MNKTIVVGLAIAAIASIMIVNFPALIAQYGTGTAQTATQEQKEECKKLGIPEFSCTEETILAKKSLLAAQQEGAYGSGTPVTMTCDSYALECRVANLESDVKLLKEKLGIQQPEQKQQQSAISVSNQHLWYDESSGSAVGGFVVRNTGERILAVESITIRGTSVPYSSWYYALDVNDIGELGSNRFPLSGSVCLNCIDKDNNGIGETNGTQANNPITLQIGQSAIIYYKVPAGKITASDIGASTSVSVFAGSAGSVQTVSTEAV